jgi:DNA (cytosine-5)-methyltransferase 1
LGYKIYSGIYDARDFGGLTSRVRSYIFASMLPSEFQQPTVTCKNTTPLWERFIEPLIIKGELRDVTECQSTIDGFKTGRARVITRDSLFSPTFLKSQNRQAKDSVFIKDEMRGRVYFPSNKLMKSLMRIKNMNFEAIGSTIEGEIIGQSIEVPLHEALLESVREHIAQANIQINRRLF